MKFHTFVIVLSSLSATSLSCLNAQTIISANDNTIDLTTGSPTIVKDAPPDSMTILDFSVFPPKVSYADNIPNSAIGPPCNLDIVPDRSMALISQSFKPVEDSSNALSPANVVHLIDLKSRNPKIIDSVTTGNQPSGLTITPDGKLALVANRADGTVSVLKIGKKTLTEVQRVQVCEPDQSLSHVAISPDGSFALASVHFGGYLAKLVIDSNGIQLTNRKYSVYGRPYGIVITPDGKLAVVAGAGFGDGLDKDAVSIIDLSSEYPSTIDHVTVGRIPEGIAVSPDSQLVAVVCMEGSNLSPDDPLLTINANMYVLRRKGNTFIHQNKFPILAIPQGAAFTSDGKYLVTASNAHKALQIFSIHNGDVRATDTTIKVNGRPASIRASR